MLGKEDGIAPCHNFDLYPGEQILSSITGAIRYEPLGGFKKGQLCNLVCTNLRLIFSPLENKMEHSISSTSNLSSPQEVTPLKYQSQSDSNGSLTSSSHHINKKITNNRLTATKCKKIFSHNIEEECPQLALLAYSRSVHTYRDRPFIFHPNIEYVVCSPIKIFYKGRRLPTPIRHGPTKIYPVTSNIGSFVKHHPSNPKNQLIFQIFCKDLRVESFSLKAHDPKGLPSPSTPYSNDRRDDKQASTLPDILEDREEGGANKERPNPVPSDDPCTLLSTLLTCASRSKPLLYLPLAASSVTTNSNDPVASANNHVVISGNKGRYRRSSVGAAHRTTTNHDVRIFLDSKDWLAELERLNVKSGWRVTLANELFHLCHSLPASFVVPANMVDGYLKTIVLPYHYCGDDDRGRVPTWCWTSRYGCSLVRSSATGSRLAFDRKARHFLPTMVAANRNSWRGGKDSKDRSTESSSSSFKSESASQEEMEFVLFDTLRSLHPNRKLPIRIDVDRELFGGDRPRASALAENVYANTNGGSSGQAEDTTGLFASSHGKAYHNACPGIQKLHQSFRSLKKLIRERMVTYDRWILATGGSVGIRKPRAGTRKDPPPPTSNSNDHVTRNKLWTLSPRPQGRNVASSRNSLASNFVASSLASSKEPSPSSSSSITSSVATLPTSQNEVAFSGMGSVPYRIRASGGSLRSTGTFASEASSLVSPTSPHLAHSFFDSHLGPRGSGGKRRWLSAYESTGWPAFVRACVQTASTVAYHVIVDQLSVIVVERKSTLFSPLITSLAILLMDPYARTIPGFESLIQKEWVVMGHPFGTIYGNVPSCNGTANGHDGKPKKKPKHAPIFHLFLECIWQVSLQYPSAFAFSEHYLIHLSDSCYEPLYDTFTFDNMHERCKFYKDLINDLEPKSPAHVRDDHARSTLPPSRSRPTTHHRLGMDATTNNGRTSLTIDNNEMISLHSSKDQRYLYLQNSIWNGGCFCSELDKRGNVVHNQKCSSSTNCPLPVAFRNPWYYFSKTFAPNFSTDPASKPNHTTHNLSNLSNKLNNRSRPPLSNLILSQSSNSHYLAPKISQPMMAFWSDYYLRWWHPTNPNSKSTNRGLNGLNGNEMLAFRTHTVLRELSTLVLECDRLERKFRRK